MAIGIVLRGRLGNQMFQYAAARVTAERLSTDVILLVAPDFPARAIRRAVLRRPEILLADFPNARYRRLDLTDRSCRFASKAVYEKRLERRFPKEYEAPRKSISGLRVEHFSEAFQEIEDNTMLNGYFQSEKYFYHRSVDVNNWFAPSARILERVARLEAACPFPPSESLAVHARLGDYQTHFFNVDGVRHSYALGMDYYAEALANFPADMPLVVFSDSPSRAVKMFERRRIWVTPPVADRIAFAFMSKFTQITISNSTFSWWAAWLGKDAKNVVAPRFQLGRSVGVWYPADIEVQTWTYV